MSIVARIPRRMGGSTELPTPDPAAAVWRDQGTNFTVALGGLPFILANVNDNPLIRRTTEYKKQQVDQSAEPGEQSIAQWWIHSQSSFHLGAGQKFSDTPTPNGGDVAKLRYYSSYGIDPWTEGQVSLLRQTQQVVASGSISLLTADADAGATQFLVASGSTLTRVTETVAGGNPSYVTSSVTWGGSGTILGLCTDGTYYYVANSTAVYKGLLTGVSPGVGTLLVSWPSTASNVVLGYVKARVIAAVNIGGGTPAASVYTLPATATTLPAANYSHYNTQWKWTAITEGPDSIFISGYAGNHSEIHKFTLDTQGAMPTLSGAATAAVLPDGELVFGMRGALGSTIGISTSRGIRVGVFNGATQGGFSLGPLSVTSNAMGGGITFAGHWYYAAGAHEDGTAGIFRVDTSQQISIRQFSYTPDERFGWANDVRAADSEAPVAGMATAVASTVDGRAAFVVPGHGLYVTYPTRLVPAGVLTTSKVRFSTLDPKLYRFVSIRGESNSPVDSGTINVSVAADDLAGQSIGGMALSQRTATGDLASDVQQAISAQITFTLTRSELDAAIGPVLTSYQLKALPAQRRQRDIVLPLRIFDNEKDNSGTKIGGDGSALKRLLALEAKEQSSDITTLQFLGATGDQDLTELVVIDKIEYHMTSDPSLRQNWGGVAVVTCHTVT